jgi:hypothetical protein
VAELRCWQSVLGRQSRSGSATEIRRGDRAHALVDWQHRVGMKASESSSSIFFGIRSLEGLGEPSPEQKVWLGCKHNDGNTLM